MSVLKDIATFFPKTSFDWNSILQELLLKLSFPGCALCDIRPEKVSKISGFQTLYPTSASMINVCPKDPKQFSLYHNSDNYYVPKKFRKKVELNCTLFEVNMLSAYP